MLDDPKFLEAQEKKHLRLFLQTLGVGCVSAIAGFSLLVPAFTLDGSRFDYQTWCVMPKWKPVEERSCIGKIHQGIKWRVAKEASQSPEFRGKVTFLQEIPATNGNSYIFGFGSAVLFGVSGILCALAKGQIANKLDVLVFNYKIRLITNSLAAERDLELLSTYESQLRTQALKELDNVHTEEMRMLTTPEEQFVAREEGRIQGELDLLRLEHDKAALRASTAKQLESEAKHLVERKKLQHKLDSDDLWLDDTKANYDKLTKAQLVSLLKEHEDGWLYELVGSPLPLWVLGSQGSWKSNFAACIALCRQVINNWQIHSITDPHAHQNIHKGEAWYHLQELEPAIFGITPEGEGYYWLGVEESIQEAFTRWSTRGKDDERIQTIWDEVTKYGLRDNDGNYLVPSGNEFMFRIYGDTRKANEVPILIGHTFTNKGTAGEGTKQLREDGSIRLWLGRNNTQKPTFKGRLEGWVDANGVPLEEKQVSIPKEWFNQKSLMSIINL